tara:strand:+ start:638 stop:739 length:102 start_codon:yes stop_codon:yes gene_type:complete
VITAPLFIKGACLLLAKLAEMALKGKFDFVVVL